MLTMKKIIMVMALPAVLLAACSNGGQADTESGDTAYNKRSANGNMDHTMNADSADGANTSAQADDASRQFLMDAADGGMAEVEGGNMAQQKASNADVKNFGAMMVKDHSAANEKVKSLAAQRNVTLPATPSDKHKKMAADMNKMSGRQFDKAYMDMMVADHKKDISMFEKALNDTKDEGVRSFITATLPTLRMHLDSAMAIQKRVK